MQYLSCSIRWGYYRHILHLVLTHDTIQLNNLSRHKKSELKYEYATEIRYVNVIILLIFPKIIIKNLFLIYTTKLFNN